MSAPFPSVLVANRGEIACRIFRTARAMGMRTIAVYSDADAKAKHVREADVAVHIGAAPAAESYLRGDKILAAAKETGAAAIHPGYGFLSENPEFAEAVIAAGLIWIGPTPAAIRAMGLKDEAKRIAIAAGVPVLAGYQGEDQSEKRLLDEAKAIGFPVLIKAVAGGGGRGIREVGAAKDFKDQLASARREAKAAFGDDRVLVEKLVQRPRHIEVQVFGDKHGGLVHLYERDCSLQRRRQKVIEEAPAPGMTGEVRAAMTDAALKVARAVDYENAGTVEFIVDGEGPLRADGFWFLEMNTRLQVEHPVTEAVTGLDLVEWQFRVAAGETLPRKQGEIKLVGFAVEARICAENPGDNFRPSVGRIDRFDVPKWMAGRWRLDAGFDEGDLVSPHYDSLVAKAICHRMERDEAAGTLSGMLRGVSVAGIDTNLGFLCRCLLQEDFCDGQVQTGLIAENLEALTSKPPLDVVAGLLALTKLSPSGTSTFDQRDGFRLNATPHLEFSFWSGSESVRLRARREQQADKWVINCNGRERVFTECRLQTAGAAAYVDGKPLSVRVEQGRGGKTNVFISGDVVVFNPVPFDEMSAGAGDDIHAPLPGKIVALATGVGARVKKGDILVTLEAMKMEHGLKAPRDGVVAEVNAREGAQVAEGTVLVRLEAEDDA